MDWPVSNVEEAVELANEFKSKGRFDWFRGQVSDLPPYSSLHRIHASGDSIRKATAIARLEAFCSWLSGTPDLAYLLKEDHVHDLCAIAQHYGIPTHYIDFTTDPGVAGFFAGDTATPTKDGRACIYCLNTTDFADVINAIRQDRGEGLIELVTVDVRNLWRLQAQRGVFVYAAYNWDFDYPVDRITFPFSGSPAYPTRERMYPSHKSPLEQQLDQFFALESSALASAQIRKLLEERRASGDTVSWIQTDPWEQGCQPNAFRDEAAPTILKSWNPDALRDWSSVPEEDYYESMGPTLRLDIKPSADSHEASKLVSFAIRGILRSEPGVRSKAVEWKLPQLPPNVDHDRLAGMFRVAWNGMRRVPFSDEEIGDAFGSITGLLVSNFERTPDGHAMRGQFSKLYGESIEVEFSYSDHSNSRGWARRGPLTRAVRPDMIALLMAPQKHRAGDIRELFQVVNRPSLMFDFGAFKASFAKEIIPAQIVLERKPILFNPARIVAFGNP